MHLIFTNEFKYFFLVLPIKIDCRDVNFDKNFEIALKLYTLFDITFYFLPKNITNCLYEIRKEFFWYFYEVRKKSHFVIFSNLEVVGHPYCVLISN